MEDCKSAELVEEPKARLGDQYRLLGRLYGPYYIFFILFGCHRMWELFFKYILCPDCMEKFWAMQNDNSSKTALGGTIIPVMVLTSFLLPSISQVHWITRALWALSILSAILSILFACKQQNFIANLFFAGKPGTNKLLRYKASLCRVRKKGDNFPIPHLHVVLFLSGSKTFLYYALAAYVSGFGVYLGSIWKNDLDVDAAPFDDRNIFIAFMASIFVCLCIYFILDWCMIWDERQQWSNWLYYCKCEEKPPAWDSCCCKAEGSCCCKAEGSCCCETEGSCCCKAEGFCCWKAEGNSCSCKRVGAKRADEKVNECKEKPPPGILVVIRQKETRALVRGLELEGPTKMLTDVQRITALAAKSMFHLR